MESTSGPRAESLAPHEIEAATGAKMSRPWKVLETSVRKWSRFSML